MCLFQIVFLKLFPNLSIDIKYVAGAFLIMYQG